MSEQTKSDSGCGCGSLFFIALAIFILWSTNPSHEDHRKQFVQQFDKRHPVAKWFGVGDLSAILTTYHSYLLFSTTTYDDHGITFGVLGMVFCSAAAVGEAR